MEKIGLNKTYSSSQLRKQSTEQSLPPEQENKRAQYIINSYYPNSVNNPEYSVEKANQILSNTEIETDIGALN